MAPYIPAGTYTCQYYTATSDTTGGTCANIISTTVAMTQPDRPSYEVKDDVLHEQEQSIKGERPTGAFININRKVQTTRHPFEAHVHSLMIKAIQYRSCRDHSSGTRLMITGGFFHGVQSCDH